MVKILENLDPESPVPEINKIYLMCSIIFGSAGSLVLYFFINIKLRSITPYNS